MLPADSALPLVSVVAACYNHARFLRQTLDSIAAQTYPNIQLIVTDDGSKDDSVAVIRAWMAEHPEVGATLLANPQNEGICRTFNKGLAESRGVYFQVIACDDVMLPHKIATQVAAFESAPTDVAMIHTDARVIDEQGQHLHDSFWDFWSFKTPTAPTVFEQLIEQNTILAPSVLMKRTALEDLGGYDEALCYEDWDLWLRLSQKHTFLRLDEPLVAYRHFGTSTSQSGTFRKAMARDSIVLLEKHRGLSPAIDRRIDEAQRPYITALIDYNEASTGLLWRKFRYEKTRYSFYLWACALLGLSNDRAHALKQRIKSSEQ